MAAASPHAKTPPRPSAWLSTLYSLFIIVLAGTTAWMLRDWLAVDFGWFNLLFFLAMIALTEALPIELPGMQGTISVSFAMCYTAVILFGPLVGGLLTALGSLRLRELTGQVPLIQVLFNRAQLFLAAAVGGLVFNAIWDGALVTGSAMYALATMVGGIAYFITNMAAFSGYFVLKTGTPLGKFLYSIRWTVPSYMGLLPIAYLNAAVFVAVGQLGVIVFLLPLMVGRYAFKMYRELREVFISTISALAASLEARDPHTSGHAERVASYAVQVGREFGLDDERIHLLEYVAILHDIGKIGIPDHILQKPGGFDDTEWNLMKRHSEIGARILGRIKQLEQGAQWVLYHHERYDGRGYPEGLSGETIPVEARILAAADSLDAMMSQRPYKAAMTLDEARSELHRCRGTQFDPKVTDALLKVIDSGELVHAPVAQQTAEAVLQARSGDDAS